MSLGNNGEIKQLSIKITQFDHFIHCAGADDDNNNNNTLVLWPWYEASLLPAVDVV